LVMETESELVSGTESVWEGWRLRRRRTGRKGANVKLGRKGGAAEPNLFLDREGDKVFVAWMKEESVIRAQGTPLQQLAEKAARKSGNTDWNT